MSEIVSCEQMFRCSQKKKRRKKRKKRKWTTFTMSKLRLQAALYDCPFNNVSECASYDEIKTVMTHNESAIKTRQKKKIPILPDVNSKLYLNASSSQKEKLDAFYRFEGRMFRLQHKYCPHCHRVRLSLRMVKGLCEACHKSIEKFGKENNIFPTWKDDHGNIRYDIPEELLDLRIGEKLIIQRASPLVPVVHIKSGTFGSRGHVCAFPQKIEELATILPRLPETCKAVKVLRTHKTKSGSILLKAYHIRKEKVLNALRWLTKYNLEYKDVQVEESNLDWMKNKHEEELNSVTTILTPDEDVAEDNDR